MSKKVGISMRISTFFYTLKQGFISIFKNKWFSLASVATISACLFLFGLFYAILSNFQHIVKSAEEGVSVTVFFDEGITDDRIAEIGEMIQKRVEVSKVNYVSADDAWDSFKEEYLGEYSDGFTENPLADSANYEIYLKDVSMQGDLVTYLESIEGIRQVMDGKTYFGLGVKDLMDGHTVSGSSEPVITKRESEILRLIADGFTNQEIADRLFISSSTVDSHRKNLLVKFNSKNTAALVKTAISKGII